MIAGSALVAAATWGEPSAVLTGVALIAVGATATLAARASADPLLLALQGAVYTALYFLFLGSSIDGGAPPSRGDLAASLVLLALQAPIIATAISRRNAASERA